MNTAFCHNFVTQQNMINQVFQTLSVRGPIHLVCLARVGHVQMKIFHQLERRLIASKLNRKGSLFDSKVSLQILIKMILEWQMET
jgi:hypothetical protein